MNLVHHKAAAFFRDCEHAACEEYVESLKKQVTREAFFLQVNDWEDPQAKLPDLGLEHLAQRQLCRDLVRKKAELLFADTIASIRVKIAKDQAVKEKAALEENKTS